MTSERRKAVEEALILDKTISPSRARVLRAIRALTAAHEDDPDWRGASSSEIGELAGVTDRWARNQAEWLVAAGYVEKSTRREGVGRPTCLYRAKAA